jgi:large subunit ribosomal protein L5
MSYTARLQDNYRNVIVKEMMKKFKYDNVMQVPKLVKISLNMGVGGAVQDPKQLESALSELTLVTGQKAAATTAKKAISNFKLREGLKIGAKVTLRNTRMYEFLDRFLAMYVPRVRDFRGLPTNSFDGRGNYNMGLKEQIIFTEIDMDKVSKIRGLNFTFVTTAKTDAEALELFKLFGFPFKKNEKAEKALAEKAEKAGA